MERYTLLSGARKDWLSQPSNPVGLGRAESNPEFRARSSSLRLIVNRRRRNWWMSFRRGKRDSAAFVADSTRPQQCKIDDLTDLAVWKSGTELANRI
jgi:hypothetical protein